MNSTWQNASTMRRALKIILPILIVVLLGVSAFSCWSIYQLIQTIRYQTHSLAIQAKLNNLNNLIQDAEKVGQANLLLGDEDYRQEYDWTVRHIPQRLKELKHLIRGDIRQVETFGQIDGLVLQRLQQLEEQFDAEAVSREEIEDTLRSYKKGLILTRLIEKGFQEMDLRESIELNNHQRKVKLYSESAIQLIALGTILTVALILLFAFLAQNELRRRNRLLENLSQAREGATVASKLKSQFLATVSHEIRTPLNGIIGFSDLLISRGTDPEVKRMAGLIHQSGMSLLKIVSDILDFSKIEAGKMEFEISDFSIVQLVGSVVELFSLRARQKGLTLLSYVDGKIPDSLRGDAARISQVLQNLLSNAVKFTDADGILISVYTRVGAYEGEMRVRFEVRDTGVGISYEGQKLLFQPFNQLNRTEGTGLGLSICKSLVEQMNGEIGLESVPHKGTTFWFELPLPVVSGEPHVLQKPLLVKDKNLHVKLFSKASTLRNGLSSYFSEWGFNLELVAEEGVETVALENSLVLRDATKWQLSQLQEELQKNEGPPTIFLISNWWEGEQLQEVSGRYFLTVPFSRDQLIGALDRSVAKGDKAIQWNEPIPLLPPEPVPKEAKGLVLIVEDNPVNQALAEMQLLEMGYRVHTAGNGKEAISAVDRISFDMVLMDIQMPELDGIETTRRIRQLELKSGRHLKIVAVTANAVSGDRERCLAAGMDDYIAKPFQRADLERVLEGRALEASKNATAVDFEVLKDLLAKTNGRMVRRLVETFASTLVRAVGIAKSTAETRDFDRLRFQCHQMKASSFSLGARQLAKLCADLEASIEGRHDSEDVWLASCQDLLAEISKVQAELEAYQKTL